MVDKPQFQHKIGRTIMHKSNYLGRLLRDRVDSEIDIYLLTRQQWEEVEQPKLLEHLAHQDLRMIRARCPAYLLLATLHLSKKWGGTTIKRSLRSWINSYRENMTQALWQVVKLSREKGISKTLFKRDKILAKDRALTKLLPRWRSTLIILEL